MNKFRKILAISVAIISPLALAAPFYNIPQTNQMVASENASITSNTTSKIGSMTQQISNSLNTQTSSLANAIRGAVAQEAVSTTQIATADRNARIVQSEAQNATKLAQKSLDIKLNYGPQTGQGYAACKVLVENKALANAMAVAAADTAIKAVNVDNAAGTLVNSREDAAIDRAKRHKENFCSKEEVEAGQDCDKESDTPGLDSNSSVLFTSALPDSKVGIAKQAVRQNIMGNPDVRIPANMGQTANGQAYLYNVNRKSALTAFPAYSLAYLESMSEKRADLKDAKGNPLSPNEMMYATVARYYGSDEAKEWQKSMIKQMPRGLLVELAKMEGLGAWFDNQEYMTNARIEGDIASMTITTTLPMEEQLTRTRQSIARASTASLIKSSQ